jgi:hypothetical protein
VKYLRIDGIFKILHHIYGCGGTWISLNKELFYFLKTGKRNYFNYLVKGVVSADLMPDQAGNVGKPGLPVGLGNQPGVHHDLVTWPHLRPPTQARLNR